MCTVYFVKKKFPWLLSKQNFLMRCAGMCGKVKKKIKRNQRMIFQKKTSKVDFEFHHGGGMFGLSEI